jgi:hypothetical protein
MKKHLQLLTLTASATTAAFIAILAFGFVSLTIFLASAITWIALLSISAYSHERAGWLPRIEKQRVGASKSARRASLSLAA